MTALREQLTQRFVVFNDSVVHQGNAMSFTRATVVGVGVSIGLSRRAVGRPTGMGYSLIRLGCFDGDPGRAARGMATDR